jgi:uncharacterized protein
MKNTLCRPANLLKKTFIHLRLNRGMRNIVVAEHPARLVNSRPCRFALTGIGFLCIAIGLVGIVIPGLPTTVFLLIAAWAFSRSSDRFQRWLCEHPFLGPPVIAWRDHGAVPLKAKVLAIVMMAASLLVIVIYNGAGWMLPTFVGGIMAAVAAYLVTRPTARRVPRA